MSNRLFQGLVHQMRDTIDTTMGVVDETATIIACSDLSKVGTTNEFVSLDLSDSHDIFIRDGYTYKPFGSRVKPDYAVFVEGVDDAAAKYASILAITLSNIKQYYDEKYDRNNFIKNVILDNVLPGDIVIKARELHFNAEISRAVFLIRIVSANDISAYDVIQNLFPDKNKDFVFNITESDIVLVKELKSTVDSKDLEKLARSIADTLSSEFYTRVNVGIGTAVIGVKDLARSFKEAQMALEVGKVFEATTISVLLVLSITSQQHSVRLSSTKYSRLEVLILSTMKHFSLFRSSLRITSMFPKLQENFSYTEILSFIVLKKSRS